MFRFPQIFRIGNKKYRRERLLGSGAFGSVFRVRDEQGCVFALKDIPAFSQERLQTTSSEINLLMNLKHENILKLLEFDVYNWEDIPHVCLVLEYCSEGSLNEVLVDDANTFRNTLWMTQLSNAICYLHRQDIMHRDLKPENVLLDVNQNVKLADFGLAKFISTIKMANGSPDNWIATYMECYQQTFAGTPHWVAPEVYDHRYTKKADIFSLGVLFYAIAERSYVILGNTRYYGAFVPYKNAMIGIGNVMAENGPVVTVEFSLVGITRALKELILDMLEYDPRLRPDATEVQLKMNQIENRYSRNDLHVLTDNGNEHFHNVEFGCC